METKESLSDGFRELDLPCDRSACWYEAQGRRPTMEDASLARKTSKWCVYAVFDGHGGAQVSAALKRAFPRLLDRLDPTWSDARLADEIRRTFQEIDDAICRQSWANTTGSTACAILRCLVDGRVFVINLGDSRAVIFWSDGTVVFSSPDHKPGAPEETARIRKLPNPDQVRVVEGVARIRGVLSVSRAFGDAELKTDRFGRRDATDSALSAQPDVFAVRTPPRAGDSLFGLLACDGLWDVYDSVEAARTCASLLSAGKAMSPSRRTGERVCRALVEQALSRGSSDNVSVVLCRLK